MLKNQQYVFWGTRERFAQDIEVTVVIFSKAAKSKHFLYSVPLLLKYDLIISLILMQKLFLSVVDCDVVHKYTLTTQWAVWSVYLMTVVITLVPKTFYIPCEK